MADLKFHDVGQERRRPDITAEKELKGKIYPSITFNEGQLPFLAGKDVKESIEIIVKAKISGYRTAEEWDDSDKPYYTLEIKEVAENK